MSFHPNHIPGYGKIIYKWPLCRIFTPSSKDHGLKHGLLPLSHNKLPFKNHVRYIFFWLYKFVELCQVDSCMDKNNMHGDYVMAIYICYVIRWTWIIHVCMHPFRTMHMSHNSNMLFEG